MAASTQHVLRAYRHLCTSALRAVQYSEPASRTLRARIRHHFRRDPPEAFDQARIDNTVEFLRGAIRERGLEHRIVKRLCQHWWQEDRFKRKPQFFAGPNSTQTYSDKDIIKFYRNAFDPMYHELRMLNETMGMCLPDYCPP